MRASVTTRYAETRSPASVLGPHGANPTRDFQLGSCRPFHLLPSPSKLVVTFLLKPALERDPEPSARSGCSGRGCAVGAGASRWSRTCCWADRDAFHTPWRRT